MKIHGALILWAALVIISLIIGVPRLYEFYQSIPSCRDNMHYEGITGHELMWFIVLTVLIFQAIATISGVSWAEEHREEAWLQDTTHYTFRFYSIFMWIYISIISINKYANEHITIQSKTVSDEN